MVDPSTSIGLAILSAVAFASLAIELAYLIVAFVRLRKTAVRDLRDGFQQTIMELRGRR